ncbi:glycerophosphodiester phosphodiesterase family protein [Mangrovimonas xylaniphaga]|uniref:glycerophosphodiester phosphodiesterase family protein n=1 Tax=Mangrovimonas xylaniphaga TaxID=1645915 RepID=UPI000ACE7639|nr:glycerophosphodiester phosphodiesterase family protein [Mangrovimonas xylaniphaga]
MKIYKAACYFLLIAIMTNCNSKQFIWVQGHRGCRGMLPENSLPAFQRAVEVGVQTLEMDVVVSKDRKVVVSHEPFISRFYCLDPFSNEIPLVDDMAYNLYEMTYDSIRQFDCGSKQHPRFPEQQNMRTFKPLMTEVFDLADSLNKHIAYNIELKARPDYDVLYTPEPADFVQLVLTDIEEKQVFERCNLQSFDVRILEEVKKQAPEMSVALLVDETESIEEKLKELSFQPEIISPYFELLSAETVANYQALGYKIIPWTVNETAHIQRMIDYRVNSIITDYPLRALQLLNRE